jgi:hypothetical protein
VDKILQCFENEIVVVTVHHSCHEYSYAVTEILLIETSISKFFPSLIGLEASFYAYSHGLQVHLVALMV